MRRSLAVSLRASSMAGALEIHRLPPMPVHGADGGFGNQGIGGAGLALRIELHQMRAVGHALHAVLDELDRLVVFEPKESGRAHQVALAQTMTRHLLVVAFESEHCPLHDE